MTDEQILPGPFPKGTAQSSVPALVPDQLTTIYGATVDKRIAVNEPAAPISVPAAMAVVGQFWPLLLLPGEDDGESAVFGAPIYVKQVGGGTKYAPAIASALASSDVAGLALAAFPIVAEAGIQLLASGLLTLTNAQWQALTEDGSGPTAGAIYYLSQTTAGKISTTRPTTTGHFIVRIGVAIAISSTLTGLAVQIGDPVAPPPLE